MSPHLRSLLGRLRRFLATMTSPEEILRRKSDARRREFKVVRRERF